MHKRVTKTVDGNVCCRYVRNAKLPTSLNVIPPTLLSLYLHMLLLEHGMFLGGMMTVWHEVCVDVAVIGDYIAIFGVVWRDGSHCLWGVTLME
jgi:hypothetical protein